MAEPTIFAPEIVPPPGDLGKTYEVENGRIVEPPPMGTYQSMIATLLAVHLTPWVRAGGVGRVVTEFIFRIDTATNLQRRPDLAFVSYERWPRDRPLPNRDPWDVVPDLAVEVVSASNSAEGIIKKMKEYFRSGVRQVWVVYPLEEYVQVYESPAQIRVVERGGELDGGAVLPGFRLALSTWLDEEPRPEA